MSTNAPPGGGPNANVIVSTQPAEPKLPTTPEPAAPAAPTAPVVPDANALSLEPVAPAAPTAPAEPAAPANYDLGDNGLNIAAEYFVGTLGLDLNGRELTEAAKGNFHLLEAKIEVLGDKAKGAGPMLKLARESIERVKGAADKRLAETVAAVHAAVGGEANWKAVQSWARTNLAPDQLEQARSALDSGGIAAEAMAKLLLSRASTAPSVTVQGQPITSGTPVSESLQGVSPLTPEQYKTEYRKLLAKYGIKGTAKSEELKQLNARRV